MVVLVDLEADAERAATCDDLDRLAFDPAHQPRHDGRGERTRPTRQRLRLDALLERPDLHPRGAIVRRPVEDLDEVDVSALWPERRVATDARPDLFDVRRLYVTDKHHGVVGAGPDVRNRAARVERSLGVEPLRRGDEEPHGRVGVVRHGNAVHAVVGLERERLGREPGGAGEAGEAARAVPAHPRARAVRVVVVHPVVGLLLVSEAEGEQTVRADAEATRAEPPREIGEFVAREVEEPVVDDDEVVAGPMHLRKRDDELGLLHWADSPIG